MSSFNGYPSHNNYGPSAPPIPGFSSSAAASGYRPYAPPASQAYDYRPYAPPASQAYDYRPYDSPPPPAPQSYGYSPSFSGGQFGYFPQGTDPAIVSSFQAVDRDRSGSIDEWELQAALSSGYQKFSSNTIRLLMFLFGNPQILSKIGPTEFAVLWKCLGEWRGIFQRFDRDWSGEIDSAELKDALLSLGYAVPPSVIHVLISKYNDGRGGRGSLNFDSFVECGTIVKGLTEKFKEKDKRYTGSATLTYDDFMLMVLPFIVS